MKIANSKLQNSPFWHHSHFCFFFCHALWHSVYKLINYRHMLIKQHFYIVISAAFNAFTHTYTHTFFAHTHTHNHSI